MTFSNSFGGLGFGVQALRQTCPLQVKDMKEERQALLKDLTKLKAALQQLALRHQGWP